MGDDEASWQEWKARFPGGMNWRYFLGYIRDDRLMKARLCILVIAVFLTLGTVVAAVLEHWKLAIILFGVLCVSAVVGILGWKDA